MNIMAPQNASYQIESHSQTTIPISNVVVTNKYGQLPLTNALYLENTKDIFLCLWVVGILFGMALAFL